MERCKNLRVINSLKRKCEYVIENYNAFLQALVLMMFLYVGYFRMYLGKAEREEIIIELLSVMMIEILILTVKDSITQGKLNKLLFITNSINQLMPVSPEIVDNFENLILTAESDIYISGIACNNVWMHMNRIIELLHRGCRIKLLIANEDAIAENAEFYFGLENDDDKLKTAIEDVENKVTVTLNNFKLNDVIKEYYCQGMFEIRRSSQLFTLAFVGIDLETSRDNKTLKVTQYTYGCKNTQDCPRFLITLPEHEHWFKYYKAIIDKQWNSAEKYILTESCDAINSRRALMQAASTKDEG